MDRFQMAYTVLGGLGVFFLGMKYLSDSLQAMASDFIRKIINWLTTNPILAVLVGTLVTTIVQSSSITTVMVVGMVNAGLMNLAQAIGVIFGANIGTTITGWIIAIKVGKYGLLFIAVGIFPMFFTKNDKFRAFGRLIVALGLVFFGLSIMSKGLKPLRTDAEFLSTLRFFTADSYLSLLGCVLIGCITTAIVQSSSAMLGITIAMAMTGVITFQTSMGLVLGQNIGTTITAVLASIGANIEAKRAARAHAIFNVLGALVMTFVFWQYVHFIDWLVPLNPDFINSTGDKPHIAAHIAAGHTIFNVGATLLFLPFLKHLANFVTIITPGNEKVVNKLLTFHPTTMSPAICLEQAEKEIQKMMQELKGLITKTQKYISLKKSDPDLLQEIIDDEDKFDIDQKDFTIFMCSVMEASLMPDQSSLGYALIRTSDEIESVSDYCAILAKTYNKTVKDSERSLSEQAHQEFTDLLDSTASYFDLVNAYAHEENKLSLEEFMTKSDELKVKADLVRNKHLERIKTKQCNALSGLAYSDMIRLSRRLKSHTLNIVEALASAHVSTEDSKLSDLSTKAANHVASKTVVV
ncbi:hypothetical protein BVY03_03955 [bacterium K02(2017)]|nr:hypothetical protein BVY03_03955 [bacterium K02(2017)]